MGYMMDKLGEAELLDQYAEELTEEAKAALKLARVLRGNNPTPVKEMDARKSLIEEFSDIVNCARDLGLKPSEDLIQMKQKRFRLRWVIKEQTRQQEKQAKTPEPPVLKMAREIDEAMMGKQLNFEPDEDPEALKEYVTTAREVLNSILDITGRYDDYYA